MTTTLADILKASLRMAGITKQPGITPASEQYAELIPAVNRMMASYSLDGHRIYTASLDQYPLTAGQKVYTIGPGGDFDNPRPIKITAADILYPTSPVVRQTMRIITSEKEWLSIAVQDISGAPPQILYYDGGMDTNGRANIYLWFQPPAGYILELATWLQLKSDFTAVSNVVILPPGYEEMMTWNLALRIAGLYPLESALIRDASAMANARSMAAMALQNVITINSVSPPMEIEAGLNDTPIGAEFYGYGWLSGPFG